jgi:outer membrane receptor protein involved in Fe transport
MRRFKHLIAVSSVGVAFATIAPAQAQQTGETSGPPAAASPNAYPGDIIVTAQKRDQTLIEIPQSISVVSQSTLERQQAVSLIDYAGLVPGLTLQQSNPGQTRVVLRGINTGSASPTVAIYVDDTPFGSSTGQTNGSALAGDFDSFDVARIEVLKGPQGTLYGANSLGGVLKYVTNAPVLDKWEVRGQAGVEKVRHGDEGYSGAGVVNVPLGDSLALRVNGFYRHTPGFINAPSRDARDVNKADSYGGRASLLFEPSSDFSIRLTAVAQNIRADSRAAFDADPITLAPVSADPFTGAALRGLTRTEHFPDQNNVDYRLYSGTLNWNIGFATLTSVTSFSDLRQREAIDVSYTAAGPGTSLGDIITEVYGSPEELGVTQSSHIRQRKFTQELRLSSPTSDTFEWLIGGYFTREPGRIFQRYFPFTARDNALLEPGATEAATGFTDLVLAQLNSTYREYAGFGSVTWHLGSRFDITGGARYSHNNQRTRQLLDGALFGERTDLRGNSSEGVFTWSASPRFQINDRSEIYARVAKGYRPGGPNVVPPGAPADYPAEFQADTLVSYEAGFRGETADRTFGLDASVYYLDWKKIQLLATYQSSAGPVTADSNGGRARSYGAEATATIRPIAGFTTLASVSYSRAELRDDTEIGGLKGDQLPYAPRWTVSVSSDYEWPLSGDMKAFVGGSIRLVSKQPADFDTGYSDTFGRRLVLDDYTTVDLRAGIDTGMFTISVYAKNVGNARGLIYAGTYGQRPGGAIDLSPIRPRTIGATLGFSL